MHKNLNKVTKKVLITSINILNNKFYKCCNYIAFKNY